MATQVARQRDRRHPLTDAQSALRRVATLVAMESPLGDVMAGVAEAVATLLGDVDWAVARDDSDGMATVLARSDGSPMPVGARVPIDLRTAYGQAILEGRPARIDYAAAQDWEIARIAKEHGIHEAVSCPVVVRGRTWGAMSVGWRSPDLFPPETETILAGFSELVAAAIANAEARAQVGRLIGEQAALRRVATLVAENPESHELISAVAREVAQVMDVRGVLVERFEADGSQVILGSSFDVELAGADALLGVGVRFPLVPGTLAAGIFETHRSTRVEDYSTLEGSMGDAARAVGIGSGSAAPIVVDGRLWGLMCVYSKKGTVLPAVTEAHLEEFVELVATAISNYEARASLRLLADEQAALRRVATLVARGATPEDVFGAVANEVDVLFGGDVSAILRFEEDPGTAIVLGDVGGPHEAGDRVNLDPGYVVRRVRETGRSARFDTQDPTAEALGSLVRTIGITSAVATPIMVEGELWGAITAASLSGPLAPAAERRLMEFTELVATAVANSQAREQVTTLAEEQAALRRVATLVAHGARPLDLFAAVAEEVGLLHAADHGFLTRIESDQTVTAMARWTNTGERSPVVLPRRYPFGPLATAIVQGGGPVRIDPYSDPTAGVLEAGLRSSVAAPITVEGETWGMIGVSSMTAERPPPSGTEERLTKFADLVATAIANAESREALARIAEEQAALRRVAELIAHEASPTDLFDSVADEAARVLGIAAVGLLRFDPDGMATLVAGRDPQVHDRGDPDVARPSALPRSPWDRPAPGTRFALGGENPISDVLRTGQPARMDDWA